MNVAIVSKEISPEIISYYKKQFENDIVNIISPCFKEIKKYDNIVEIPDDKILNKAELRKRVDIPRFNWYYQQFLKYTIILYFDSEETLIIDGDSFLKRETVVGGELLTTGKDAFVGYVSFNKLLIEGIYDRIKMPTSFVTNQMLFKKKSVLEIIGLIEKKTNLDWIEGIVEILRQGDYIQFSEYQLYADYMILKAEVKVREVKVFRRMDLLDVSIDKALNKYSIIAYECNHRNDFLRKLRARIYYYLNINFG